MKNIDSKPFLKHEWTGFCSTKLKEKIGFSILLLLRQSGPQIGSNPGNPAWRTKYSWKKRGMLPTVQCYPRGCRLYRHIQAGFKLGCSASNVATAAQSQYRASCLPSFSAMEQHSHQWMQRRHTQNKNVIYSFNVRSSYMFNKGFPETNGQSRPQCSSSIEREERIVCWGPTVPKK